MKSWQAALDSLGLTERESEVYVSLVRTGEVSMGTLLRETGLRPQVAYDTVRRLAEKKLAYVTSQNGKQQVSAASPLVLEQLAEGQLSQVRSAVPQLLMLQGSAPNAVARIERGNEAVASLRERAYGQLKKGDCYYVIGASGSRFYRAMGFNRYQLLEDGRATKGVHKKLVTFESQREEIGKGEQGLKLTESRFLPYDYPIPTSTNIYSNTVVEIIWSDVPLLVFITSKEVADSYRNYFRALWETASA